MVYSAMAASIASPMMTRTLTAVDPRTAIRGHVHQLHILCMILFRQGPLRHREPRSGVAIQENVGRPTFPLDRFAPFAMTVLL